MVVGYGGGGGGGEEGGGRFFFGKVYVNDEMRFAYGLLLRGSGACTMNPNLHALGASRAMLQLPFFSLMAPRRP